MRWFKKRAPAPAIPAYPPPPFEVKPIERAKDQGIVVEEIDTSAMTQTGVHKAWNRLSGRQS